MDNLFSSKSFSLMFLGQAVFSLGRTIEIYKSCNLKVKAVLIGDLLKGNGSRLDVGEVMRIFKKHKKELSSIIQKKIGAFWEVEYQVENLLISYNHG